MSAPCHRCGVGRRALANYCHACGAGLPMSDRQKHALASTIAIMAGIVFFGALMFLG